MIVPEQLPLCLERSSRQLSRKREDESGERGGKLSVVSRRPTRSHKP